MDRIFILSEGTIETIVVELQDTLGVITDLALTAPVYEVFKADASEAAVASNVSCVPDGMTLLCQVNTTGYAEGDYDMWVRLTVGSDTPRLYAGRFRVE